MAEGSYRELGFEYPDFKILRDVVRSTLTDSLKKFSDTKDLVLDTDVLKKMDRVIGAILLKENGVDKIFRMDGSLPVPLPICSRRIFVVAADVSKVKQVANHINADISAGVKCKYQLMLVPRKLHVCERILEQEGVYGFVEIEDLNFGLIPLDTDLLSLEMPELFKSVFLENDSTTIHTVATSLVDIQSLFGRISHVHGQGRAAKMTFDLMNLLLGERKTTTPKSEIGYLFLFDREIDYATALLSQLTYHGILDETFGIQCGYVDFGTQVTGSQQSSKVSLTSEDKVFEEIRDRHISTVFMFLKDRARALQLGAEKRQNMSLGEVKTFVTQELKNVQQMHQSLALNISACEVIMKRSNEFEERLDLEHSLLENYDYQGSLATIEEMIIRQFPVLQTLRILCLFSLTCDGLLSKDYRNLKALFLQSHGYEHLITFMNLQKLGLFTEHDTGVNKNNISSQIKASKIAGKVAAAALAALPQRSSFQAIKKKFDLVPKSDDSYNLKDPKDLGYVFNGVYIPLTCHYVKKVLTKDTPGGLEDSTKLLAGPAFSHNLPQSSRGVGGQNQSGPERASKKVILVYFLGGVTYAETAAFRLLGKLMGYKFIIAATSIVNGNTLLDGVIQDAINLRESPPE